MHLEQDLIPKVPYSVYCCRVTLFILIFRLICTRPITTKSESINLTNKCIDRLKGIIISTGDHLRVIVEGGGFLYKFELDNKINEGDK